MNTADVFKLREPDQYGNWGLELRNPIRTTDAKFFTRGPMGVSRVRDTLLTPPTKAELAANAERVASMTGLDLGRVWAGDLKPKLDAVKDRKQLGDALSSLVTELAAYGTARGRREGDEDPLDGHGKPNPDDPAAARTGDAMRQWRNQDSARIQSMQGANRKMWPDRKPAT